MSEERESKHNSEISDLKDEVSKLSGSLQIVSQMALANAQGQIVNPVMHGFTELTETLKGIAVHFQPLINLAPAVPHLPKAHSHRLSHLFHAMQVPNYSNIASLNVPEPPVVFIGEILPANRDDDTVESRSSI